MLAYITDTSLHHIQDALWIPVCQHSPGPPTSYLEKNIPVNHSLSSFVANHQTCAVKSKLYIEDQMKIPLACLFVASVLSGCGGGGEAIPPTGGGNGNLLPFGTMLSQYEALETTIDATPFSTPSQLPRSGSATYSGYAGFGNAAQTSVDLLAEADLSVDFGTSTLSGRLSKFQNANGENYSGIVTFQNGVISGAAVNSNSLQADLSGQLTSSAGTQNFTGHLTGAFSGDNADFAEGLINGNFAGAPLFGYLYTEQP